MSEPVSGVSPAGAPICAACGNAIAGRFCSHCGAPADSGTCPACHSPLSPGARFCHRCGSRVRGSALASRERMAWIIAGIALLLASLAVLWRSGSFRAAPAPQMGNVGSVGAGLSGRAPDISQMTPDEQFFRLWDRIERATTNGDTLTVRQFAPMALGAYAQLPGPTSDQRFHAALINLAIGEVDAALALADTILAQAPGQLLAYVIRGEVAERRNRTADLTRAYRDFLSHYDAELKAGRPEYADHQPLLDDFRTRARAATGRP